MILNLLLPFGMGSNGLSKKSNKIPRILRKRNVETGLKQAYFFQGINPNHRF
jgi:hypothetical protein